MSAKPPFPDRRKVLAASAAVAASSLFPAQTHAAATSDEIRPFQIDVPDDELVELRRRILATRWPERETVAYDSQGVPLARLPQTHSITTKQRRTLCGLGTAATLLRRGSRRLQVIAVVRAKGGAHNVGAAFPGWRLRMDESHWRSRL